jgi:hypothetical protein
MGSSGPTEGVSSNNHRAVDELSVTGILIVQSTWQSTSSRTHIRPRASFHPKQLDGASLCQTSWPPVVWLRLAGPVSDLSEVLVKGCEPAALDARVAPACPAGPAPARVVASRRSWR